MATKPSAPTTPIIEYVSNNSFALQIYDNANGGAAITARQIGISTSSSSSNANWYTVTPSGLGMFEGAPGSTWYAWGRVKNSVGWSSVSGRRTIKLHNVPGNPTQPSVSSITNNSAYLTFSDGATNGSSITSRRLYWNTSNTISGAAYVSSDRSTTITTFPPRTTIYVWAIIANQYGWSGYSAVRSFKTHDIPSKPTRPSISSIFQTEAHATFSDGANNGASITSRRLYWNTSNTTSGSTIVSSDGSTDLKNLPPGTKIYIWSRTYNKYGWSPLSSVQTFTTVAGGWVNKSGTWIAAVPFKRVSGAWKLLEPYVRVSGSWRRGG